MMKGRENRNPIVALGNRRLNLIMRRSAHLSITVGVFLACTALVVRAVDPIPESDQASRALKIIDAYGGPRLEKRPKLLHVVYFTPADREPAARYPERLSAILEDIRVFYRDEMKRLGFGPQTFDLPRDLDGRLIIHLVRSKQPESAFPGWQARG